MSRYDAYGKADVIEHGGLTWTGRYDCYRAELCHGHTISVSRSSVRGEGYHVEFASVRLKRDFAERAEAMTAGIKLARRVIRNLAESLPKEGP